MSQKKTWDIRRWDSRPARTKGIDLMCPVCGTDAELEISAEPVALIIAAIGLDIVFEPADYVPPDNWMPDEIRCRHCRKIFSSEGVSNVR